MVLMCLGFILTFSSFSQDKWKDFIGYMDEFDVFGKEIFTHKEYDFLMEIQKKNGEKYYMTQGEGGAYYEIGKISLEKGNVMMLYATKSDNGMTYYMSLNAKNGKQFNWLILGNSKANEKPDSFIIKKNSDGYEIITKEFIFGIDSVTSYKYNLDGTKP